MGSLFLLNFFLLYITFLLSLLSVRFSVKSVKSGNDKCSQNAKKEPN